MIVVLELVVIWLHLIYISYCANAATANDTINSDNNKNKDDDEEEKDSGGNDVADRADTDIGGAATKAAGNTSYMSPSGKTNDRDSDGHADDGHDNVQQDDEQDDGQDDEQDDEQDDDPKAPKTFVPSNLLIILVAGVLSSSCEPVLNYVCDDKADKNKLAPVPSHKDCWETGLLEPETPSTITKSKHKDSIITHLKRHADYNEVYKEAKVEIACKGSNWMKKRQQKR